MLPKAEDIRAYTFSTADALFLDANIWLFVFGPQSLGDPRTAIYSTALNKMLTAGSRLYIDVLVLSEFVNTYARIHYSLAKSASSFKAFRKSSAFRPIAHGLAADAKRVLRHCQPVNDPFETLDLAGLLDEFGKGDSDINDQVIVRLCQQHGYQLVTDDSDFSGKGISVITANKKITP